MKRHEGDIAELDGLERDIGALFDATSPELDQIRLGRIAARAASGKRRSGWSLRLIAIGLSCTGILAGVLMLGGQSSEPSTTGGERERATPLAQTDSSTSPTIETADAVLKTEASEAYSRRLPPELDELGSGIDDEVKLAMGTYLDMDFEGGSLEFDDWDGGSEGVSEEQLLRATDELLRNGS